MHELGLATSQSVAEVESFVYKGFPNAKDLTDLVDRIAIYMAENRNTKLKVVRHSPRRHASVWRHSDAYGVLTRLFPKCNSTFCDSA